MGAVPGREAAEDSARSGRVPIVATETQQMMLILVLHQPSSLVRNVRRHRAHIYPLKRIAPCNSIVHEPKTKRL